MSEQLQFFKGNTEEALEAKAGSYIPGAIYHCLDTGNTYLALDANNKQLFATTNSGVTKVSIVRWDGVQ
jgi:hypothetical protein